MWSGDHNGLYSPFCPVEGEEKYIFLKQKSRQYVTQFFSLFKSVIIWLVVLGSHPKQAQT